MNAIRSWHICISGFRQDRGQPHGTWRLWRLLAPLRAPEVEVELYPWNADWASIAEMIQLSKNGHAVRVHIYAYSWGAGSGFPWLARELHSRGIDVTAAVLSDPVYRSRLVSLRWLAFCRKPVIRVPANVRKVWSYRQELDPWIRGHRLVADDPKRTTIFQEHILGRRHAWMDDSPTWHAMSVALAGAGTPKRGMK